MGKIWIKTSSGNIIHLPIVGEDKNNPDIIDLPETAVLTSINRCYSGQIVVNHPTYGQITFDFSVPGRTGSCNQCGLCCSHPIDQCPGKDCGYVLYTRLNIHICRYLNILRWSKWGEPQNSECLIHQDILNLSKGCALFPGTAAELGPWSDGFCGYSF